MKLIELLQSPWAIVPESLREIQEIYATHLKGDKIDLEGVEARLGRPLNNQPANSYTLREGGVALISVEGVIAPKANLFTDISGGTSSQILVKQLQTAAADTRVKSVLQVIDSPGGSVMGTPEWGAAVKAVGALKPIVSVSDGVMYSAAYWGGSAANAVYLTGAMGQAGSIGVYARMGLSQPDPTGIEFVRGNYKRGGINGERPSAEFMARYESQLDYMYSLFVDTVAANRDASSDDVLTYMADGRTFIGQQAVDAGLVDGIQTIDALVEAMATDPAQFATRRKAVFALGAISPASAQAGAPVVPQQAEPVLLASKPPATSIKGPTTMDRATLQTQHPELFATLQSEFTAAGAAAERQRIADVRAALLPGHEALIERLAADGTTTGAQAALAIVAAEQQQQAAHRQAQASGALQPVPQVPAAPVAPAAAAPGDNSPEAVEARAKTAWDKDANLRNDFAGSFATYLAYAKANANGQVRILKTTTE